MSLTPKDKNIDVSRFMILDISSHSANDFGSFKNYIYLPMGLSIER